MLSTLWLTLKDYRVWRVLIWVSNIVLRRTTSTTDFGAMAIGPNEPAAVSDPTTRSGVP
ncbi:MAG: hypothetical protein ABF876_15920 [Acetobacter aceti]|uniref:hypothetical protein n=1 Tax=Acetobacter aceti TaxID=435 RepID=UPI00165743BD|nr:hypothetical protein [Acetobacter aceti]